MNPREIDALVAEKVMGWHEYLFNAGDVMTEHKDYRDENHAWTGWYPDSWRPTEFIAQAWVVVEKMHELKYGFSLRSTPEGEHRATFFENWTAQPKTFKAEDYAPTAICLAALAALEAA